MAGDFELLLASLDAPRGEFWRVHGGVLSHAAWTWPEVRERTVEGEPVRDSHVTLDVLDLPGAEAALDADPELERVDPELERVDPELERVDPELERAGRGSSERATTWRRRWDPPSARRPPPELGVRVELCPADADPAPYLATVTLGARHRDLFCLASTRGRLELARALLAQRLDGILGAAGPVRSADPGVMPRWRRMRLAGAVAAQRCSQAA